MRSELLGRFGYFFRPEDSGTSRGEDDCVWSTTDRAGRKSSISLKALIWIAISIAAGLLLGQLH